MREYFVVIVNVSCGNRQLDVQHEGYHHYPSTEEIHKAMKYYENYQGLTEVVKANYARVEKRYTLEEI
ncbi:hypothetical protein M5X02_31945 [Paenibacillus alvei]|uniref:hypothetical protein n=1 Tax=Paenibacillus alvei TaxID=44250 RepID=UPI000289BC48|nr:hypothetical protein [Paenibacillus alvei]EJW13973.1 hypothetical protein PAV_141p00790 [Paenibacillus alvei DSM 29]MCY9545242.1 hypothetical protein [Paenibacillus alvei]MCY9707665.1 hypothetical protein [Paenibacillus alvei]MEC0082823.1 hypothetical protein [Paenibacillus alvei]